MEAENSLAVPQTDPESLLSLALDIGKSMIKCGAEINRVEETIVRICSAYGMKQAESFQLFQ